MRDHKTLNPATHAARLKNIGVMEFGKVERSEPDLDGYTLWGRIVQSYTFGNLSQEDDKLIAVSGIARHMGRELNDRYLAGLWERHLPYLLLWEVHNEPRLPKYDGRCRRPKSYQAPSWSWALIVCSVKNACRITRLDHGNILIKVLDVQVFALTDDMMGQVTGGYLRIRGPLSKATLAAPYGILQMQVAGTEIYSSKERDIEEYEHGYIEDHDLGNNIHCIPVRKAMVEGLPHLYGLLLEPTGLAKANIGVLEPSVQMT